MDCLGLLDFCAYFSFQGFPMDPPSRFVFVHKVRRAMKGDVGKARVSCFYFGGFWWQKSSIGIQGSKEISKSYSYVFRCNSSEKKKSWIQPPLRFLHLWKKEHERTKLL